MRNFDITDWPDSLFDIRDAFTGAGQTLTIDVRPGTEISHYRLQFTEPYIFGTRNALTLQGMKSTIFRNEYLEDELTFSPIISHAFDFDRDFVFSLGARLSDVEVHEIEEGAPKDAVEAKGHSTIIAGKTGVLYDKLLHELYEGPYSGSAHSALYEYGGGPLGGDVDYHKLDLKNDFYYPLYTYKRGPETYHHIISLVNHFGVIEPHSNTDEIPIFERYFLGGPKTVRGFKRYGLGPRALDVQNRQTKEPNGGAASLWGNLEYTFPIYRKTLPNSALVLRGLAFFDYGNLAPTMLDFDVDEMRYVVGAGLRLIIPVPGQPIPISLYFGFPLKKEDEDRERMFLFSAGFPF
jgi:outer membrane protein insertion porin family